MDDKRDIDAWADAFLDQHRSAPPPSKEPGDISVLPPGMRILFKLRPGEPPDAEMVARLLRSAERQKRFANMEATFMMIGLVLVCGFVLTVLSGF